MTRLERIKYLISIGYTYDKETGNVFNKKGEVVGRQKYTNGYFYCCFRKCNKIYKLSTHHFAWYYTYKVNPISIDHIDGDITNNKIDNLRSGTQQQNLFNLHNIKGYTKTKNNRYLSKISAYNKTICLGTFDTPEEAHQAYLDAKKIYHIIS